MKPHVVQACSMERERTAALEGHINKLLERGAGIAEHSRATLAACSHTTASHNSARSHAGDRGRGRQGDSRRASPDSVAADTLDELAWMVDGPHAAAGGRRYRSQGSSPRLLGSRGTGRSSSRPASACGYAHGARNGWGAVARAAGDGFGADAELRQLALRLQALPGRLPQAVKGGPEWDALALQISDVVLWQVCALPPPVRRTTAGIAPCTCSRTSAAPTRMFLLPCAPISNEVGEMDSIVA